MTHLGQNSNLIAMGHRFRKARYTLEMEHAR
jgi:hypothetical protein